MHNQLKKVSQEPQAFTIPYADENGYITNWLSSDPLIQSLQQQTEFIGTVATAPEPDTQTILTQFVYDTAGRAPRNGDEVAIEDVGELWLFNGTTWNFFTNTTLKDATTTSKGIVQIGSGLDVLSGVVSVDSTIYTPSRTVSTNTTATTANISNVAKGTDYIFTQPLTSLTLGTIENSTYYTDIYFTTGNTFSFSATNLTQYYFSANPPTFNANTSYKIHIAEGKAHISYIGARIYPINKITVLNPALTPSSGIATWTITNTLGIRDVIIRVMDNSTGETVATNSTTTVSTITLTFNADVNVPAETYKAIIIG